MASSEVFKISVSHCDIQLPYKLCPEPCWSEHETNKIIQGL